MDNKIPSSLLPNEALAASQPQPAQAPEAQQPASPYTIPLLQHETKAIMPVDQDHADVAIRSGEYSPKKDQEFIVLDKYGNRNVVTGQYVREALNSEMRLETASERRERELEENYGGAGGMAQSFGAGVARGGTLGLSDLVGHADPAVQQRLADLKDANPIASTVGEIAGFIGGSMLGSTEGSLATRGVVGAAEKLGAKAAAQVERAIIKDATKAGLSKKTSASIASKMAQEMTIGSLAGAGTLVSENALGKADVNAENLVAAIGMGALVGGAFGASLGAAEAAMPLVKAGGKQVTGLLDDYTSRDKAALEVFGYTPAKAVKLKQKNPQMAEGLADFLQNDLKLTAADDALSLEQKVIALKKQAGAAVGDTLDEVDAIVRGNPVLQPKGKELFQDLAQELEEKFLGGLNPKSPEFRSLRKEVQSYYDEIIKSAHDGGTLTLKDLHQFRKGADTKGYGSNGLPVDTLEGQMARYARRFYDTRLRGLMEKTANSIERPDLLAGFANANRQFSYASEVLPKVMNKAAKSESINPLLATVVGGGLGAVGGDGDFGAISVGAIGALGARSFIRSDMRRNLVVLGKIERAQQQIAKLTDRAVKGFVGAPIKAAVRSVPYSIMNSELAKKFENGKYKKPKDVAEAFANMSDNFARYEQNPEAFMARVNRTTSSMYKQAPNTSMALDTLAVTSAMFLGSKLPKRKATPGMLDLFNKPRPPSQLDLKKFEKYLGAVENPESVFHDMERGQLSPESVEALQAVYPNLYNQLREKTLELVGQNPKMPYSRKLQLGLLLNVPTDESLLPENVLGLQSLFSAENQQEQSMVKPTVAGTKELNGAEAMATDTQDLSEV